MYLEDSEYDYIVDELQRALALLDKLGQTGYCFNSTSPQAKEDHRMGQISSITIRASDGIKTADYAPPKLYDITAIIVPTDDDNVDQLLTDTLSRIDRAGQKYLTGRTSVGEPTGALHAPAEETKPATRKRRTTAEIAADAALAAAAHPKGAEGAAKDPASITDDEPSAPEDDPSQAGGVDDFNIEPEGEADETITDAALNAAVQRKNAELSDPEAIRAVIKGYNPDPTKAFQLREIPQDKRAEFITKLGGLTKASA